MGIAWYTHIFEISSSELVYRSYVFILPIFTGTMILNVNSHHDILVREAVELYYFKNELKISYLKMEWNGI